MEEKIQQFKTKEFLIEEYNKHLRMYVISLVEAEFAGGRPQNEIVFSFIQPSGNPQVPGMERNIKAKDAQMKARQEMSKQDSILKVIQRLIIQEDKKETKFE
jgi:hypothetical protein